MTFTPKEGSAKAMGFMYLQRSDVLPVQESGAVSDTAHSYIFSSVMATLDLVLGCGRE